MKTKTAASEESSGLRVGDVVKLDGVEQVVWFKNESRAAVAPLNSRIEFRVRDEDQKIQFLAKQDSMNISPNSEVVILRSLGRKGLAEYLTTRKTEGNNSTMSKNKSKNETTTTTTKEPRHGKLGGYKGHSVTSVIRAFGKAGWNLAEARAWFEQEKIAVADTTIVIQLRAGRIGEGGDPADFSKKELDSMKPEVEVPEPKSSKKDKNNNKPAGKSKKSGKSKSKPKDEDEENVNEEAVGAAVDGDEE